MKSYTSPRRTSIKVLEVLGEEYPHLKESIIPEMLKQLPSLATNKAFHQMAFSSNSVPKTLKLFKQYEELNRLWSLFIVEIDK
jgi:hypothetical protein